MSGAPDFEGVLRSLVESQVRFVLIRGLAMIAQGTANLTRDIDCLYERNPENIKKIVTALRSTHPKLRTSGEPVSIVWDAEFFKNVLNVTLSTDRGPVNLLAEVPGLDDFQQLWDRAPEMKLFGLPVRVASVDDLIRMKTATGRSRDKEHALQLQALKKITMRRHTGATAPIMESEPQQRGSRSAGELQSLPREWERTTCTTERVMYPTNQVSRLFSIFQY